MTASASDVAYDGIRHMLSVVNWRPARVDHDADAAEYLMQKHIQNGYEEALCNFTAQGDKPRIPGERAPGGGRLD